MSAPTQREEFQPNLFGPAFRADPYPTYARLQAEDPVHARTNARCVTTWYVTGYDDVAAILRDHTRFVKDFRHTLTPADLAALPAEPPLLQLVSRHMLNMDPPDHTRLRALVNKAFTARMIEQLAPRVQAIADELLAPVLPRGAMDLIEEFAFPLPIIVIAELLGVPPADRNRFRAWSRALVAPSPDVARTLQKFAKAQHTMAEFVDYLRAICAERRRAPQDDLLTALLQAEDGGDTLREDELFSMILLLVVVGHETSVNLIGNGMLALLQHPAALAQVRADPTRIDGALDEMLRYDCPVERAPMRFAAVDVELHGRTIRRGDSVSLVLGAANRDPRIFPVPTTFDIHRTNNRHLAFGLGIHYCLGAALGRLEGRVAVNTLLRRCPDIRLAVAPDTLRWHANPIMRGVHQLPVVWSTG
ncbi:MAG: cytochrome P450 [Caldilineaceae bacterium]|nr:cytochrome P450 [Caldilineaceae bacterium]